MGEYKQRGGKMTDRCGWKNGKFTQEQWTEDYRRNRREVMPAIIALAFITAVVLFTLCGLLYGWRPEIPLGEAMLATATGLLFGGILIVAYVVWQST